MIIRIPGLLFFSLLVFGLNANILVANGRNLRAGVARVSITNVQPGDVVNDSLYVRALVLDNGSMKTVIISVDAVAIGGIGSISNEYFSNVRSIIEHDLGIPPINILINASHVHGAGYQVSPEVEQLTVNAVKKASMDMVSVRVGAGSGYEDRIMENRRLRLRDGREWTIRHANPLPPDEEVVGIGPVDPEIGILRLDKRNGDPFAVVFNFACHPYQGVPGGAVTADFSGIASQVIEETFGNGTIALFLQGFGGDVTTVLYKDVNHPRDAEPLGNMLGLSTLKALRGIQTSRSSQLNVINEVVSFPRRTDFPELLASLEAEQDKLLQSLMGMSLNFKSFLPLYVKYNIFEEYPSYDSHRYMHEAARGQSGMENMDSVNRRNMERYLRNVYAMEKLARLQTNISTLKLRQAENEASGEETIDLEIQALRIGDFVLVTFPAEVSVQVGLNIKERSLFEFTFPTGYTNGYVHYAPTAEQYNGQAYEDISCLLDRQWQQIYEEKILEILKRL
jgi:hypothetical protein